MQRTFPALSRRVLLASTLATLTITAAGAATYHRLAVTQSAGGGSEGATEFLQTSSTGGAVQGEVASSAYTGLSYPFGLFGFYHGSSFGIGTLGISATGYGVAGAGTGSQPAILAYGEGSGPALQAVTTMKGNPSAAIVAAPASGAVADGIDASIDSGGNSSSGQYALSGMDTANNGSMNAGVFGATTGDSAGVMGIASAGAGLGNSTGVFGASDDDGVGVQGQGQGGPAVAGFSYSGDGVEAQSVSSYGVVAEQTTLASPSPNIGDESGLYASSQNGAGVYAYSKQDPAIVAEMGCNKYINNFDQNQQSCEGLLVVQDGNSGYPLLVYEPGSTQTCSSPKYPFYVNSAGDVVECGTTTTSDVYQRSPDPSSDTVTYAAKQTESTVEDFGSAQLVNGMASIPLAADYRRAINANATYMVFLTQYGDGNGLYVGWRSITASSRARMDGSARACRTNHRSSRTRPRTGIRRARRTRNSPRSPKPAIAHCCEAAKQYRLQNCLPCVHIATLRRRYPRNLQRRSYG
jgi:hypothetical protein